MFSKNELDINCGWLDASTVGIVSISNIFNLQNILTCPVLIHSVLHLCHY